jgi:cytochrome c553
MSAAWSEAVRSLKTFRAGRATKNGRMASPKRRAIETIQLRSVFLIAILTVVFVGVGRAQHGIAASSQDVQAKISYCKDCHGPSAQGYRGYFPIPRLAGQQPAYLENQLQAFIEHRRTNNVMFNVAHSLSPSMLAALAANFHALNPPPIGGAPRQLVATGRKIFQDGMPDENIAACAACHGPDATGSGQIPRLAGQLYPYVIKELTNWGKERGQNPARPDISAVMSPVAHSLNERQIEAVAAYVSTLK